MRISKAKQQRLNATRKVTFGSQNVLIRLLQAYLPLRSDLLKLTASSRKICPLDEIFAICAKLPKSLQRNRNIENELLLMNQIAVMVANFLQIRSKHRQKPYKLYMSFKQLSDILIYRLRCGLRGNFQELSNNPEVLKLFYFTKQLEDITKDLEQWAKHAKTDTSRHQSRITFVFPNKEGEKTNRLTQPSTAYISRDLSRHEKRTTLDDFNNRNSQYMLFRSNTAKIERKELKMTIRCPSAAQVLKKESYKKPSFEMKRSYKKIKHKSTDFESTKKDRESLEGGNKSNSNILKEKSIECEQDGLKSTRKTRKVSILNKSMKDKDSDEEIVFRRSQKKGLNIEQKAKKSNFSNFFLQKKKTPVDLDDSHSQEEPEKSIKEVVLSQCEIYQRKQDRKLTNMSIKKLQCSSLCDSSQSQNSAQEPSDPDKGILIRQRKIYKKVRRSGKVMKKQKDDLVDVYMLNVPKKLNTARRRKAIMSTHKDDQFAQLQNILQQEQDMAIKKKLEFDENVLLAVSDAIKSRIKNTSRKELQKEKTSRQSLGSLFAEINTFINQHQEGIDQNAPTSVFFEQQEQARLSEDQTIRDKMQQLMNKSHSTTANVFELNCREVNNKDTIYNQIHRYFSFASDSDWIRHAFAPANDLVQKAL